MTHFQHLINNGIWNEIRQRIPRFKYPYTCSSSVNHDSVCKFIINDPIEEYRIVKFGDEKSFLDKFLDYIQKDDVFFDIGSNIGLYSIYAAKKVVKVISFEPDDEIRVRLVKNISINNAKNISVIDWAVSDIEETRSLYSDGTGGYSPSLCEIKGRFKGHKTISCNSIDNAIRDKILPIPTVIKIDIEGAEYLALRGMNKLLVSKKSPRIIFIEIHPLFLKDFNSSSDETIHFLESCGYKLEYKNCRDNEIHCIFIKEPQ
ncbi:hypothetical protein EO98_01285 [Methanosarcina sp. 2.H.T.1A.6]|uniref:FkbM family methyltransferase n=1 Tax=unclassified Methanosarcina TaxID=2644672 RepID=UPI000620EF0F|nr:MULTISPECIES: FkbM family methyltransferase [unclassified Methanosarcina]KKG09817.1 hypothetical protein EO97_01385 [Methanosarcina sp. 2.H.T.1A.15]KKG14907.1 hypothetical protein EO94_13350 [Methanosarcina sp. 2.H.T.1A.3]KKG21033.1 hypothetical protein EO98_01285 [Methanosarcina sp. 2.H.T.1A.6]KKG27282.1 hypothetical protein EO96_10120 [Methanosarcina sp. 2.H.T.1A.8]